MNVAEAVVTAIKAYALIGVLFGVYFGFSGARKLDRSAEGAGLGFKLIIIPGAAALWPLLAFRLILGSKPPTELNEHRRAVRAERNR